MTTASKTVSSAAVRDVYLVCQELNLLTDQIKKDFGLNETLFNDPEKRLPESVLIKLWTLLEQHDSESGLGLSIGQTIAPESKGILASWISQANTLEEALDIFTANIALMNPSEAWQIEKTDSQVTLSLDWQGLESYPASAIERSMSAMTVWARALSAHSFPLSSASFTFAEPSYKNLFAPIFGDHIVFAARFNSLIFDNKLLKLTVINSNQLLKNLIEQKAQAALAQLSKEALLHEKVTLLIQNSLSHNQSINVEQACKVLAKSRQTLYRQLKAEGTDFKTLYDEARKQKALALLNERRSNISAISLQLGFKDNSSFYKAFRRWTGMIPKDYQQMSGSK